jgi:predicted nucleic acid-binding protein
MKTVVDASVVAKRLVPEPESDKARALFLRWAEGTMDLLAPDILAAEIANMLWKRAARGLIRTSTATVLYREFQELQVPLWPCERLAEQALQVALQHGHPAYDCLYVALAAEMGAELVTADEKLWRTFHPVFPEVRLLRDWR